MAVFCKHYGSCGGCDFQEREYPAQLEYKSRYCRNLFASFGCTPEPIVGSPVQRYFRNKLELTVSGTADRPLIGQRRRERFDQVVDFCECPVFSVHLPELLEICRDWVRENGIEPYDLRRKKGELRFISLRHSKAYDEILVTVICNLEPDALARHHRYRGLFDRLAARLPVRSLYLSCNKGAADNAVAGACHRLSGSGYVREKVNIIEYIVRPSTFFQTNTACCELLYSTLREAAAGMDGRIYDIYCGSGGIALQLAQMGRDVAGIDLSERNIEDARHNCELNGLKAEFLCRDADAFLEELGGQDARQSGMVIDPPRNGLTGEFISRLAAGGPEQWIYVSCNPLKLREDLKKLAKNYSLSRLIPVDMFPHTRHIEVICLLKRNQ